MKSDTPRTDACPYCKDSLCEPASLVRDNLCWMREQAVKAEAKVDFWKSKAHEAEDREGKLESEVEGLKKELFRTDIRWDDEVEFSRQLERELAESQAEVERLEEKLKHAVYLLKSYNPSYSDLFAKEFK